MKAISSGCWKALPTLFLALLISSLFGGITSIGVIEKANAQQAGNNTTSSSSSTAGGTTVSMAKGSQAASNPEFYVPTEATVKPGETVTWKNDDTAIHTATSGKDASPDGKFDTSLVSPGQSSNPIAMPNEPPMDGRNCNCRLS